MLMATRLKTTKPFLRNQVTAESRTKGCHSTKARKGPQPVVFRLKNLLWYLTCAEAASDGLEILSFLGWFLENLF